MKFSELENICTQVTNLTGETAGMILAGRGSLKQENISRKGLHDFVTKVDLASEKQLIGGLKKILPGSGFLAEEQKAIRGNSYTWIIDPLDGTTNFIHGAPPFAISIALMKEDRLVLGVVYEIVSSECFYTWEKAPAYLNGQIIKVSETASLGNALVATGFPYSNFSRLAPFMQTLEYCMRHTHGVRRLGSAAIDMAYLACGRYDAFWEYGLNAWDVAAGSLLIENAGGRVSDFSGKQNHLFGKEIVAATRGIFEEFLQMTASFFKGTPDNRKE